MYFLLYIQNTCHVIDGHVTDLSSSLYNIPHYDTSLLVDLLNGVFSSAPLLQSRLFLLTSS